MNTKENTRGISLVVPCYNEATAITATITNLHRVLSGTGLDFEIIVVNDASKDESGAKLAEISLDKVTVLTNDFNMGYGASLKVGIEKSRYPWIGITDADGTYPVEGFPELLAHMDEYDMVVGTRTGKKRAIPLLRRPAKWFLNRFSSFLVKRKIEDVNSGMRIFKKELAFKFWNLFPQGFSFTTTLTLAMIMGNHRTRNIPIDYLKRKGRSKINPIKDFYNFTLLIMRITMLFNPLRIFMPIFFFTTLLTTASLVRDIYFLNLTDTTVMLFIFSIIILMIGLLADLINKRFPGK